MVCTTSHPTQFDFGAQRIRELISQRLLGRGTFGSVSLVTCGRTEGHFALKWVDFPTETSPLYEEASQSMKSGVQVGIEVGPMSAYLLQCRASWCDKVKAYIQTVSSLTIKTPQGSLVAIEGVKLSTIARKFSSWFTLEKTWYICIYRPFTTLETWPHSSKEMPATMWSVGKQQIYTGKIVSNRSYAAAAAAAWDHPISCNATLKSWYECISG